MDPTLLSFLRTVQVDAKVSPHTHTTAQPQGAYNIVDSKDLAEFHRIYNQVIRSGGVATVTEKPLEVVPLLVDIDYRFSLDGGLRRYYTAETVRSLIEVYHDIIDEIVAEPKPHYKYCVVLEKPKPRMDRQLGKDGFHLHFPYFLTEQWVQTTHIRTRAIQLATERGVFNGIPFKESLDKVFDVNVPRNHWLMYGSRKLLTAEPYLISKYYDNENEKISFGKFFKFHPLVTNGVANVDKDGDESSTESSASSSQRRSKPLMERLPEYLSIRVDADATELKYGAVVRPSKKRKAKEDDGPSRTSRTLEQIYTDVTTSRTLLDMLSSDRADDHNKWMEVGWILYNVGEGQRVALDAWIDFSDRCQDKDTHDRTKQRCEDEWQRMEAKNMTLASLKYLARLDSPQEYEQYQQELIGKTLEMGISATHNDVAKVLFHIFEGKYLCADSKNEIWFEFIGHRWQRVDDAISLKRHISSTLVDEYHKISMEYLKNSMATQDPGKKQEYGAKVASIAKVVNKLKDHNFKRCVTKEAKEFFYDPMFYQLMDSNKDLFVFENGVFDTIKKEFRDGRPDDYCTKSCGRYYYEHFNEAHPLVIEFNKILDEIFVNPNIRRFFVLTTCSLLRGGNRHKLFLFWTGVSNNGKSVLADLIKKSFGSYYYAPPTTLITGKQGQSSNATPDLVPLKGARVIVMSETSKADAFNEGMMKKLSSGDDLSARALYQGQITIEPHYVPIVHTNNLPKLDAADQGSWNRVAVIEFQSIFTKDRSKVPRSYADQLETKTFMMDTTLKGRIGDFADMFLWYLVENYKMYGDQDIIMPDEVVEASNAYRRNNNHFLRFFEARVVRAIDSPRCVLKFSQVYMAFSKYFKESYPGVTPPDTSVAQTEFEKLIGELPKNGLDIDKNWYGWKLAMPKADAMDDSEHAGAKRLCVDIGSTNNGNTENARPSTQLFAPLVE